jgi:hypothetical protein
MSGAPSRGERPAVVRNAAGARSGNRETGAAFVERLRSGRLSRLFARDALRLEIPLV